MDYSHFEGKKPQEHLNQAKQKGKSLLMEPHGKELSGPIFSFLDVIRENVALLGSLMILTSFFPSISTLLIFLFATIYCFYKGGRAAFLGWNRLERLHQMIEEERWEIEHHRPQEKEELKEMYKAKGFTGKLLDEAVEVLMADDNRLLEVMLVEELGLSLQSFEHPLKQGLFAFLGGILSALFMIVGFVFIPSYYGIILISGIFVGISVTIEAKKQNTKVISTIVKNLAFLYLCYLTTYFLTQTAMQIF